MYPIDGLLLGDFIFVWWNNVFKKNNNVKNIDSYYNNIVKPQYSEKNVAYKGMQDDDDFGD